MANNSGIDAIKDNGISILRADSQLHRQSRGIERNGSISLRSDGLYNVLSKLGGSQDKSQRNVWVNQLGHGRSVGDGELLVDDREDMYARDGIMARIIDLPARDSTKNGWEWSVDEGGLDEQVLQDAEDDLDLVKKLRKADIWSRIYGGAIAYIHLDDNKRPDQPVDYEDVQGIELIELASRKYVEIMEVGDEPGNYYNEPLKFKIEDRKKDGDDHTIVHADRVLFFPGEGVGLDSADNEDLWGTNVPERIWDQFSNFQQADNALGHTLHQANQHIWKVKGLAKLAESGSDEAMEKIQNKINSIQLSRSVVNMMLMDLENEDFEAVPTNIDGMSELHQRLLISLAAVTGIPIVKLLGINPPGLSTDDKAGKDNWSNKVSDRQTRIYNPKLLKFARLVAASTLDSVEEIESISFSVEFESIQEKSEEEKATVFQLLASAVKTLVDATMPLDKALEFIGKSGFLGNREPTERSSNGE